MIEIKTETKEKRLIPHSETTPGIAALTDHFHRSLPLTSEVHHLYLSNYPEPPKRRSEPTVAESVKSSLEVPKGETVGPLTDMAKHQDHIQQHVPPVYSFSIVGKEVSQVSARIFSRTMVRSLETRSELMAVDCYNGSRKVITTRDQLYKQH